MQTLFHYRDHVEGKVGIGKIPQHLLPILDKIAKEYYVTIPNKDASTYHTWYTDMSDSLKFNINILQEDPFWKKLCDNSKQCIYLNATDMDELYYSNPKTISNTNLYGATGNYDIHKDCVFNFDGIRFYRVLIGLTNGNQNIVTYFNHFDTGHNLNKGDYITFDFDKTTHQVIKKNRTKTPRIMLKLHYIVCENCKYNASYVDFLKKYT